MFKKKGKTQQPRLEIIFLNLIKDSYQTPAIHIKHNDEMLKTFPVP